jgi:hypothetical protein
MALGACLVALVGASRDGTLLVVLTRPVVCCIVHALYCMLHLLQLALQLLC